MLHFVKIVALVRGIFLKFVYFSISFSRQKLYKWCVYQVCKNVALVRGGRGTRGVGEVGGGVPENLSKTSLFVLF